MSIRVFLLSMIVFIFVSHLHADDTTDDPDSLRSLAPNVYIDCSGCDRDYLRTEIPFVNFVRDRRQADIHILVSDQRTGGGGRENTIEFMGQGKFAEMADTLIYISNETDTDDMIREGITSVFKIGLTRYVAKTPLGEYLSIAYSKPASPTAVKDKWDSWVFEIGGNCWFDGEKSYRSLSINGDIEASRVTEKSKIEFGFWGNYNEDKYDYEDYKALSISRSKGFDGGYIRSLTDHWSAGLWSDVYSSTYSNKAMQAKITPAVEYNIFPYDQSNRRQLRLGYNVGVVYTDYEEETIYGKTTEWLAGQSLEVTLELVQPWGSIYVSLSGSHYLHDLGKNKAQLYSRLSVRIIEGLSVDFNGSVSRIHDQISLRKGGANEEEVLLRRRELATSYDYWGSVGISYSFGSIYNNVVNPRFGN
ncbi:MAG: hypothetical protein V3W18_05925 [candidate division Zixibacteria bacterium]